MDYENDNKIEKRKADNRLISTSKELDDYENQIEFEKNRLQELSDMQESVDAIADNINECIELLSKSIKGPNMENIFNDMHNSNKTFQIKTSANIENSLLDSRKKLNELYKEKEKILDDNKEKQNSNKEE